jgi:hypothetical protein
MAKPNAAPTLDSQLREMLDHHEITKLLSRYCHACDRLDPVETASVYWEDSWDDHGPIQATGPEFAVLGLRALAQISTSCNHQLGQSLIRVDGDSAGAETYFQAVTRSSREDGGEDLNLMGGRFIDMLERRGGQWKIKSRLVVRDWSITQPICQDWLSGMNHTSGQRSNDDPSCAVLRMRHAVNF